MSQQGNWLQRRDGVEILLIVALSGLAIILSYTFYMMPIWKAEHDKAIAQIDSFTCKELGAWLINNAQNMTDTKDSPNTVYHYGQAKYLVCTHGGTSP